MWLFFVLLPPSSIAAFTQYLPISRCIQQISTYIGGLLAFIAVAALYRRSAGSPLGVVVAPIFLVLSLPLVDVVLLGLYAQAYYLFGKASLLIYVLILSVCPSLLGVFVLWLLFVLLLCLYIDIKQQYCCFAFYCSVWCSLIGSCNSIQVLIL